MLRVRVPVTSVFSAAAHSGRRFASEVPKAGGAKGGGALGAQVEPETMGQKVKKEMIKTLKLNLVLMPLCFCGMLWMYPPVSQSEKMQERYERSAGWKT